MPKVIMEGIPAVEFEDGRMAMIAEITGPGTLFARIQSWDDTKEHTLLKQFAGQKVRITVETMEG